MIQLQSSGYCAAKVQGGIDFLALFTLRSWSIFADVVDYNFRSSDFAGSRSLLYYVLVDSFAMIRLL